MTTSLTIRVFALPLALMLVAAWVLSPAVRPGSAQKTIALFPIVVNGKYGYINQTGTVVIEPRFDVAKRFSEGLARVMVGSKWGFINETGKIVMQPQFELENEDRDNDFSLDFHEGMAAVSLDKGQKWGFIDKSGSVIIPLKYGRVSRFSDGIAQVDAEGPYPLVRKVSPGETPAPTPIRDSWYIDKTGKILEFPMVGEAFSEGMAVVSIGPRVSSKLGYIDRTGQTRIRARFEIARSFHDGLASVRTTNEDTWGYIDKAGKFAIRPRYFHSEPRSFSEGLASIDNITGEWGFIDKKGALVIERRFIVVGRFSEGLAGACSMEPKPNGTCGFINRTGKWVISNLDFALIVASDFYQGLALVWGENFYGYIDKRGKYVWRRAEDVDPRRLVGCTLWPLFGTDYGDGNCRHSNIL